MMNKRHLMMLNFVIEHLMNMLYHVDSKCLVEELVMTRKDELCVYENFLNKYLLVEVEDHWWV